MILKPPTTPTRQLTWHCADRQWVGEHSSTNGFGRVYDDACDEGLTLVGDRTGREVVYVVDHTEVEDGEIRYWILVPAAPQAGAAATRWGTILLFND